MRLAYSGISDRRHRRGPRPAARLGGVVTGMQPGTSSSPATSPTPASNCCDDADHDVVAWDRRRRRSRGDELLRRVAGADAIVTLLTETGRRRAARRRRAAVAGGRATWPSATTTSTSPRCRARGVIATNTPGVLTDATADIAMALILMATRGSVRASGSSVRGKPWQWGMFMMLGTGIAGCAGWASSAWVRSARHWPVGPGRSA